MCSTGNCTWPEYHSLGVCANVVDMSSMLLRNPCDQNALDGFFQDAGIENPGFPCFNYTLPFTTLNTIEASNISNIRGNATLSNVMPLLGTPDFTSMQILTAATGLGSSNFSVTDAYLIYQNISQSINSSLIKPVAYGISVGLCVHTYRTSVSNGITSTSKISSQPFDSEMTESV